LSLFLLCISCTAYFLLALAYLAAVAKIVQ
jgi:hypothetical protein